MRAMGGGDGLQGGPNIIGQLMRSPVVENLVQQVMQGVGDVDGGGGGRRGGASDGLNLSGMLRQVVPAVTQMLNGGSLGAFPGSAGGTSARSLGDGAARATASREAEAERWEDALTPVRKTFRIDGLPVIAVISDMCLMVKLVYIWQFVVVRCGYHR